MAEIRTLIREIARGGSEAVLLTGTVTAVDKEKLTVDVLPLADDAPVLGVNLQANQEGTVGVVALPRIDSYVVVGMLPGYATGVVLLTDDVEEVRVKIGDRSMKVTEDGIVLNGGENGGLINIEPFIQALNSLITAFNGHTHGNNGAAAPVPQMQQLDKNGYEDKTVTH